MALGSLDFTTPSYPPSTCGQERLSRSLDAAQAPRPTRDQYGSHRADDLAKRGAVWSPRDSCTPRRRPRGRQRGRRASARARAPLDAGGRPAARLGVRLGRGRIPRPAVAPGHCAAGSLRHRRAHSCCRTAPRATRGQGRLSPGLVDDADGAFHSFKKITPDRNPKAGDPPRSRQGHTALATRSCPLYGADSGTRREPGERFAVDSEPGRGVALSRFAGLGVLLICAAFAATSSAAPLRSTHGSAPKSTCSHVAKLTVALNLSNGASVTPPASCKCPGKPCTGLDNVSDQNPQQLFARETLKSGLGKLTFSSTAPPLPFTCSLSNTGVGTILPGGKSSPAGPVIFKVSTGVFSCWATDGSARDPPGD